MMVFPHLLTVKFYLATCECTEGYKGRFCGEVTDVCHPNPCYHDNSCTAVIGPPRGHKCGPCPDGLSGNGEKCGGNIFGVCLHNQSRRLRHYFLVYLRCLHKDLKQLIWKKSNEKV